MPSQAQRIGKFARYLCTKPTRNTGTAGIIARFSCVGYKYIDLKRKEPAYKTTFYPRGGRVVFHSHGAREVFFLSLGFTEYWTRPARIDPVLTNTLIRRLIEWGQPTQFRQGWTMILETDGSRHTNRLAQTALVAFSCSLELEPRLKQTVPVHLDTMYFFFAKCDW